MLQSKKTLRVFWFFVYPAFLILAVYPPRISGYLNPLDDGIWLGVAQAILDGRTVYRDVFFLYGLLLSCYLQAALRILPHTVAALRWSFWVLNTAALLTIYSALLRWVRNVYLRLGYAAFLFCVPLSAHVMTIPMAGRYAAGFLPLLFWPGSEEKTRKGRVLSFMAGASTAGAIFISQEVGIAALLANAYAYTSFKEERRRFGAFLLGLAIVALPVLFWLLGTHNLHAYVDCTFRQAPALVRQESLPAPRFTIPSNVPWFIVWQVSADSIALYLPAILYAAAWICLIVGKFGVFKDRKLLTGLLIYGTAASISAWMRSDRWHIYFALTPALFLWAVVADRLSSVWKEGLILAALVLGVLLTYPHARARIYKDAFIREFSRRTDIPRMGASRLPVVQAQGYEYLVHWVDSHVKPGSSFLFFPYDGNMYFLTDRPNPTFYPVLILACTPSMLARVVRDLRSCPPEWLIWDTDNNAFDGKRIDELLRPVCEFIATHYVVKEKTGPFLFMQQVGRS